MHAAILCPGPSLADTCISDYALAQFDQVIAVNRAILLRKALLVHWHACGDWDLLYAIPVKPLVGICTQRDVIRITTGGERAAAYAHLAWSAWEDLPVAPGFSTISAFALAAKLGCTHLTVFGDDKQGTGDWDGAAGRCRSDDRWARERELQDRAIGKLDLSVEYITRKPSEAAP